MSKAAVAIISLLAGLVVGGVGASMVVGGAAAGAGAGAGIMTGMCSTIQAAQNAGVMTPEQADQTLAQVVKDLSDEDVGPGQINGTAEGCAEFMAQYAN